MLRWIKTKIIEPIVKTIKKGISPRKLAISLTLGISIGLIPLYGVSTLIITFLAFALKLDLVVMQAVHYVVHPIQIALFIPFFKLGNLFFSTVTEEITFKGFMLQIKADFWTTLAELWKANLSAILVWGILAIPLSYLLYFTFLHVFKNYYSSLVRKPVCKA